MARRMAQTGEVADQAMMDAMREQWGLDKPIHIQYWRWFRNLLSGNMGYSFLLNRAIVKGPS